MVRKIFSSKSQRNARAKHKHFSIVPWIIILILALTHLRQIMIFGNEFKSVSKAFINIRFDGDIKEIRDSYVVSDYPIHEAYQLTLYGSLFYLTDGWGGIFFPDDKHLTKKLLYLTKNSDNNLILRDIGTINIGATFKGPLNLEQIRSSTNGDK